MRNQVEDSYVKVWRRVCMEWLRWTHERFDRFVRAFNCKLEREKGGAWFYHEPPFYHIISLLVTDRFDERLHSEVRKPEYGTSEWIYFHEEIQAAIEGRVFYSDDFDWVAARKRTEEHLARYGETFPRPEEVTNYEKWILGFEAS
jgi:hypothetical protein